MATSGSFGGQGGGGGGGGGSGPDEDDPVVRMLQAQMASLGGIQGRLVNQRLS
eukprot:CAMPEP_0203910302 /NCGR_PEP_ID=MMETSP0359-20131031/51541_1 /ASSEMBLY_ACC=CAM_ASM_000338 /TAXON_ID=268821 /ORGANISM="Scrippsiella Hangoei, Strain SHTV-5" /LENGTH=52 /DNA_ID=CAMNT_0050835743 /DNA_START=1 /DNA_END=159 /DNA_ORIENTATION=+